MPKKSKNKKQLTRKNEGRVFAGVCAGLADYFNIDVVIVRLIWIFLLVPGGAPGFIPYIILWLITPEEKS